jgi:hypothetical protein
MDWDFDSHPSTRLTSSRQTNSFLSNTRPVRCEALDLIFVGALIIHVVKE